MMTYTELKTNVQDITEMTFTDAQLAMFTKQAEQKIYGFVKDLPILRRRTDDGFSASSGYPLPADCVYVHSVIQRTGSASTAKQHQLIQKDPEFLREAYPLITQPNTDGVAEPLFKYYAIEGMDNGAGTASNADEIARMRLMIAPGYSESGSFYVIYQTGQPVSIVDFSNPNYNSTWLGGNYDSALLNATLIEAARFMKSEPDIVQLYEQQFMLALQPLVDTANVRIKNDSYRPTSSPARPLTVPAPAQPPQREG